MEEFNKVKNEIVNKYLKDTNLHETKKEAFRIWLKQLEYNHSYFKSNHPHIIEEHVKEYQEDDFLDDFKETFKRIVEFQDIDLLATVNYYANFVWGGNILFHTLFFDFYDDYKFFIDSNIDEKNYLKEITSLEKKRVELQKFSTQEIILDKAPKHPAFLIRDFFSLLSPLSNEQALTFVNIIISKLSNKHYLKLPKATKMYEEALKFDKVILPYVRQYLKGEISDDEYKKIHDKLIEEF